MNSVSRRAFLTTAGVAGGMLAVPAAARAARASARLHLLGVFAPLVGALVFKTSGGFEQSSLWVRFPYTPVSLYYEKCCDKLEVA